MQDRSLIWFRSDLRLGDNTAFAEALRHSEGGLIAVFVATPHQWSEHDWGPARVDFLLRNLHSLAERLKEKGVPLLLRQTPDFGGVAEELLTLATDLNCDRLFFNREYEVNESRRDQDVTDRFVARGLAVHAFDDQTILPPAMVRTQQGSFYSKFSPYRRQWLRTLIDRGLPQLQTEPLEPKFRLDLGGDHLPTWLKGFEEHRGLAALWPAGEAEALSRLQRFTAEAIYTYDDGRDRAAVDLTSRLSPYLALGVLSPRECLAAATAANDGRLEGGSPGASAWITELIWREFYRHVLVGFPRVSKGRPFKLETESLEWEDAPDHFAAWCEGRTGIPFVDAGMRQLLETGWMHNRLRMVTAMFLTKDLLVDWRLGERFFMQNLIDGDQASNNGGWQWSASTGTDAAPYFRIFNPWTQGARFDPRGDYIRRFVPELEGLDTATLHRPDRLAKCCEGLGYPPPIVDHAAARLRAIERFRSRSGPTQ